MPIYRRCLFQWGSTAAYSVTKSLNLINLSPVTALCLCCPIGAHLTHKITRVFSAGLLFWVIVGTQILWYMFLKVYQHLCLRPACYQIFLFVFLPPVYFYCDIIDITALCKFKVYLYQWPHFQLSLICLSLWWLILCVRLAGPQHASVWEGVFLMR